MPTSPQGKISICDLINWRHDPQRDGRSAPLLAQFSCKNNIPIFCCCDSQIDILFSECRFCELDIKYDERHSGLIEIFYKMSKITPRKWIPSKFLECLIRNINDHDVFRNFEWSPKIEIRIYPDEFEIFINSGHRQKDDHNKHKKLRRLKTNRNLIFSSLPLGDEINQDLFLLIFLLILQRKSQQLLQSLGTRLNEVMPGRVFSSRK